MAGAQKPPAEAEAAQEAAAMLAQEAAAMLVEGPALPTLDDLRAMVREEVQAALAGFADELRAGLASNTAEPSDPQEMQARTIQHGMFVYDLPGGGQAVAWRGHTVDLLPHDVERGEKIAAFTAKPGVLPEPAGSTLPTFPLDASEAEHDAWVGSGSVQEIITAVNARPEILSAVIAAEQRRGDAARVTLLDALAKLRTA